MEDGKKKIVMVGVVAASLVLAGFITFSTISKKGSGLNELKGQTVLCKCRNPECNHTFTMDMKDYYEYLRDNPGEKALSCPKCGQKTVYEAIKCEKCGNVFFIDRSKRDFFDRCPKCGFSKEEKQRQEEKN